MKLFLQNLLVMSCIFSFLVLLFLVGKWASSLLTNDEVLQMFTGSSVVVLFCISLGITFEESKK